LLQLARPRSPQIHQFGHRLAGRSSTIVDEISFDRRGEWTQPQILMTQFQHDKGHDLARFDQTGTQVILYPPKFKSGNLVYPFPSNGN
jgi:hypothetical protein